MAGHVQSHSEGVVSVRPFGELRVGSELVEGRAWFDKLRANGIMRLTTNGLCTCPDVMVISNHKGGMVRLVPAARFLGLHPESLRRKYLYGLLPENAVQKDGGVLWFDLEILKAVKEWA